jgi:hypothetical protein
MASRRTIIHSREASDIDPSGEAYVAAKCDTMVCSCPMVIFQFLHRRQGIRASVSKSRTRETSRQRAQPSLGPMCHGMQTKVLTLASTFDKHALLIRKTTDTNTDTVPYHVKVRHNSGIPRRMDRFLKIPSSSAISSATSTTDWT